MRACVFIIVNNHPLGPVHPLHTQNEKFSDLRSPEKLTTFIFTIIFFRTTNNNNF